MRSVFISVASFVAAIAMTGCSKVGFYQDAQTSDAVVIEFINETPNVTLTEMVFEEDHDCSGMKYIYYFSRVPKVSVLVAPRERYTVKYDYFIGGHYNLNSSSATTCGGAYTFDMESANYRIASYFDGEECGLRILKQDEQGWTPVASPIKRETAVPWSASGSWCKAVQ